MKPHTSYSNDQNYVHSEKNKNLDQDELDKLKGEYGLNVPGSNANRSKAIYGDNYSLQQNVDRTLQMSDKSKNYPKVHHDDFYNKGSGHMNWNPEDDTGVPINDVNLIYLEYVALLEPDNTQELHVFSVEHLSRIIEDCIFDILQSKNLYRKLINLIEINLPDDKRQFQIKILETLSRFLSEERALDGVQDKILERIVRNFTRQGHELQDVFIQLIFNHIVKSNYSVNIASLMEMIKCPYKGLQMLGLKIMVKYFN